MTEPTYQRGEIVDIYIRDARVVEDEDGYLTYEYATPGQEDPGRASLAHWATSVSVKRVMPAAGPPKVGELWEDARGRRYLAVPYGDEVRLNDGRGGGPMTVGVVHSMLGPIKPVYRDEDGGESGE